MSVLLASDLGVMLVCYSNPRKHAPFPEAPRCFADLVHAKKGDLARQQQMNMYKYIQYKL